jgi:hypothetical protein
VNVSTVTGPSGNSESQVSVGTTQAGLVTGEPIDFFFTTSMTDQFGDALPATQVAGTLSVAVKPLRRVAPHRAGPVAQPVPAGVPKPPAPRPPANPKPAPPR